MQGQDLNQRPLGCENDKKSIFSTLANTDDAASYQEEGQEVVFEPLLDPAWEQCDASLSFLDWGWPARFRHSSGFRSANILIQLKQLVYTPDA